MAKTPLKPLSAVCQDADDLLKEISSLRAVVADIAAEYEAAVERIREEYRQRMAPFNADLEKAEKEIVALMKGHRREVFAAGDILALTHGALIRELAEKVKIPRDALAKCEALGFSEAVKIAKSLDRAVVEGWPDERLFLIGAERKLVEEFKYDLKEESAS